MTNVKNLLHSRKFVLALVYLVVQLAISALPQLAPQVANLSALSAVIVGVSIFGITVEDAVRAWAENRPGDTPTALRTLLEEIVKELFDNQTPPSDTAKSATSTRVIDLDRNSDGTWQLRVVDGQQASSEKVSNELLLSRIGKLVDNQNSNGEAFDPAKTVKLDPVPDPAQAMPSAPKGTVG